MTATTLRKKKSAKNKYNSFGKRGPILIILLTVAFTDELRRTLG